MKDITIKGSIIRRELIIWGICFLIALLINVYAILVYNTSWSELFNTLHIVFLISLLFFGTTIIVRLLIWGIKRLVGTKKAKQ